MPIFACNVPLVSLIFLKRSLVFPILLFSCFFSISGWGIDLDYCAVERFVLEMNRDNSVVFEIAPKYCILDSFVDYEGYCISAKGILPTVVDIMVIWIKFTHSHPF